MFQSITIKNFRSIGEVTVELSPVTVLVGRSGTGKSNFLAAIKFLRDYLTLGKLAHQNMRGHWHTIVPAASPNDPLSIEVSFKIGVDSRVFRYLLSFRTYADNGQSPLTQIIDREELFVGPSQLFARQSGQPKWLTAPPLHTPPAPDQPLPMLGELPAVADASLAYAALTSGIGFYDFQGDVLWQYSRSGQKAARAVFPRGQMAGDELVGALSGLHDNAENYLIAVQAIRNDFRTQTAAKTIAARLRQLNPSVKSVDPDALHAPQALKVAHELGGKLLELDLSQESDGFRRFYAQLLTLYQVPPKQLLLIEEPENGIYPGALAALAEEFEAAAREGRGQIILTTHNPGLLDNLPIDGIRVVELDPKTHRTRIGRLAADQKQALHDSLLTPGELLSVDRPRIAEANESETGVS